MTFSIYEPFWKVTLSCIEGSTEQLADYMSEMFGEASVEVIDHIDDQYLGTSIIMPTGEILLYVKNGIGIHPEGKIGTVAHELLHVTKHVLQDVQGIPFNDDTEEVYSTMLGNLVELYMKSYYIEHDKQRKLIKSQ